MLSALLGNRPITLDIPSRRILTSEVVTWMKERAGRILCIADLPPSPPSKTRYVVRKLRAALPDVTILEPLRHQPYGQTEFVIRDPNGYALVFAEPD